MWRQSVVFPGYASLKGRQVKRAMDLHVRAWGRCPCCGLALALALALV